MYVRGLLDMYLPVDRHNYYFPSSLLLPRRTSQVGMKIFHIIRNQILFRLLSVISIMHLVSVIYSSIQRLFPACPLPATTRRHLMMITKKTTNH